jgi:urease subunit beta
VNGFFVPESVVPGEIVVGDEPIIINAGREARRITVSNTGDRPIQVGSHFHFADTNSYLSFDRAAAEGFRLDVAAGTAVRFEPGVSREVVLVALAGNRKVPGLQLRRSVEDPRG